MSAKTPLPRRSLGKNGPRVSALGLGCMGMSDFYGTRDDARNLATLAHALEAGIDFFDTADMYGPYLNEELLGRAFAGKRDAVVLATKCGILRDPHDPSKRGVDNRPDYIRRSIEGSLRRLQTDHVDLYYLHRHNPDSAPIEEAVGALGELVQAGKTRAIGLSEISADTLRRAHAVHPIAAVQSEYSLWTREPETDGVLATCRELGIAFVPYSPLGRGFLSGSIKRFEDLAPDDYRRHSPRFQGENFAKNLELVRTLEKLAAPRGVTAGQLALAWVLAQPGDIVPIPGTTRSAHLDELIAATRIELEDAEKDAIEAAFPSGSAQGNRYPTAMQTFLGR